MSITKTKQGTYRYYYSLNREERELLNTNKRAIDRRFKKKKDAEAFDKELKKELNKLLLNPQLKDGNILFKDFYKDVWLNTYKNGDATKCKTIPSKVTVENTESIFRIHILPYFGNYSLNHLNENVEFIYNVLSEKAKEYVNIKFIQSYLNSIFEVAEEFNYIESNKLSNTIRRVKPTKKIINEKKKTEKDKYLDSEELEKWLNAVNFDYDSEKLSLKDYLLFYTTFILANRKSEVSALQWKHIDFENSLLRVNQALDRDRKIKATKSNKDTIFTIPPMLLDLFAEWKAEQRKQLKKFNILQDDDQLVFTYIDTFGNLNAPLHPDYLNNKMKTIRKRHPELAHCTPHKLRHTAASLCNTIGLDIQTISKGLTHSNSQTTKIYINSENKVQNPLGEVVAQKLNISY